MSMLVLQPRISTVTDWVGSAVDVGVGDGEGVSVFAGVFVGMPDDVIVMLGTIVPVNVSVGIRIIGVAVMIPGVREGMAVQTGNGCGETLQASHAVRININININQVNTFFISLCSHILRNSIGLSTNFKKLFKLIKSQAEIFFNRRISLLVIMFLLYAVCLFPFYAPDIFTRSSSQLGSTSTSPSGKMMVGTLLLPLFILITNLVASSSPSRPIRRYLIPLVSKNAFARWQSAQYSVEYITICDGFIL